MLKFFGGREAALAASAVLPVLMSTATAAEPDAPLLSDEPVIPRLAQHDKPMPWAVMPMVQFGVAPGEMPYRQDRIIPDAGIIATLAESSRPVKLGTGYSGAGDAFESHVQASQRTPEFLVLGAVALETAGDYEDGAGNPVRFGYERHTEQAVLGWTPPGRSLKAVVLNDVIDDHKNPLARAVVQNGVALTEGFGADPIHTRRTAGKLLYDDGVSFGALDKIKVEASYANMSREADNFSLRTTPTANRMRSLPSADIVGVTAAGEFRAAGFHNRVGVETRHSGIDGVRYGGPGVNSLSQITGYQYPGVSLWEGGLSLESARDLTPDDHLLFAVRYDHVAASADRGDSLIRIGNFTGTPLSLYRAYYGSGVDEDASDGGVSARARYQRDFLDDRANAHAALGRIVRHPDAQERYFALSSANNATAAGTSSRQIGNPDLDAEIHYRGELGGELKGDGWAEWGRKGPAGGDWLASRAWKLSATAYLDYVDNFITRDRAHGQTGVLRNDNAAIWRNVDAALAGFEIDGQWNLTRNLSTRLNLAYTYGDNRTDSRPLYSIDPFEANLLVDYHDLLGSVGTWHVGGKLRAVAAQDRVDVNPASGSGYDAAATEAFALLDLYAALQFNDRFAIRFGVDNVFDKQYAENDIWLATDESNPSLVNGPGRFFYVRTVMTF